MAPRTLRRLLSAVLLVLFVSTLPLFAGKRRAVAHPVNPNTNLKFELSGSVVDDVTGAPVVAVSVDASGRASYTGSDGKFSFEVEGGVPLKVDFSRSGYVSTSVTLQTSGTHSLNVRMTPKPTVLVKRTNGTQLELDLDSITFGYPSVFSGYIDSRVVSFCRGDGTNVAVDRSEMKQITGPAMTTTVSACCSAQQVLKVNVELKTGGKSDLYFADSCFTHSIDIKGRDHVSGLFQFIRFSDITEVIFP